MTNIPAADGRIRKSDLCIQVCTIQVHKTAIFMNDGASLKSELGINTRTAILAYLLDAIFKYAESGGISDLLECRPLLAVQRYFFIP
jgi:hypothetical protein